jgi:tuftelin-interacting protein 11
MLNAKPVEPPKSKAYTVIEAKKEPKKEEKKIPKEAEPVHHKDDDHASFLDKSSVGNKVWGMMMKMGYDPNRGLGSKLDGIVNPIKVIPTANNQAIIVSDDHVQKTKTLKEETEEKGTYATRDDGKRHWKKTKKQKKVVYRTAQDLIKETKPKQEYEILDMRGPEVRKVESMNYLSAQSKILPELQHNIRTLVDLTEENIRTTDKQMKEEKDKFAELEKTQLRLEKTVKVEKERLEAMREVMDIMRKCHDRTRSLSIDLNTLLEVFSTIRHKYAALWQEYELGNFAVSIGGDMIRKAVENWNGSGDLIETLTKWRRLLQKSVVSTKRKIVKTSILPSSDDEDEEQQITNVDTKPYLSIIEVLSTKIRPILQAWTPDTDQQSVDIVEKLKHVIPHDVMQRNLGRTIIPKLLNTLEHVRDLSAAKEMHHWVHPWLPYLGDNSEDTGLFDLVRQNLSRALGDWEPLDNVQNTQAHELVSAWRDAMDLSRVINSAILPKLVYLLREQFEIDPSEQDIKPLNAAMSWMDIIGVKDMAKILEKEFFTKWIGILYEWLLQPDADYEEIMKWYGGWKGIFPDVLVREKVIRNQFKRGLDMMNQAASNQAITAHEKPITSTKRKTVVAPKPAEDVSFKDLLANYAAEMNLVFMPKGDQMIEGKQLYDFGGVTTFIENDALFVRDAKTDQWLPVSLDDFLVLVDQKKSKRKHM